MRLKTYKMAMSILPKFLTLKWNISRTIWRIEVGDGSFFAFFTLLHLNLTLFFDQRFLLKTRLQPCVCDSYDLYGDQVLNYNAVFSQSFICFCFSGPERFCVNHIVLGCCMMLNGVECAIFVCQADKQKSLCYFLSINVS